MAATNEGPDLKLPNVNDLAGFLDGADTTEPDPIVAEDEGTGLRPDDVEEPIPAGDTFDRKYVEKLRRESASYRERAKKYEQAFEGYEPGAVEEWQRLITGFREDPKTVAEEMKQISETILEQFTPQEVEEIKDAIEDNDQPLTMRQLESILHEKEQERDMANMVQDIEREASDLGYNLKSREYKILLMTAQEIPSGSIAEAHALLETERQREFDKRIADLEKAGGGYRPPNNGIVGVPSTEHGIKDFKDAKAALMNFLDSNK